MPSPDVAEFNPAEAETEADTPEDLAETAESSDQPSGAQPEEDVAPVFVPSEQMRAAQRGLEALFNQERMALMNVDFEDQAQLKEHEGRLRDLLQETKGMHADNLQHSIVMSLNQVLRVQGKMTESAEALIAEATGEEDDGAQPETDGATQPAEGATLEGADDEGISDSSAQPAVEAGSEVAPDAKEQVEADAERDELTGLRAEIARATADRLRNAQQLLQQFAAGPNTEGIPPAIVNKLVNPTLPRQIAEDLQDLDSLGDFEAMAQKQTERPNSSTELMQVFKRQFDNASRFMSTIEEAREQQARLDTWRQDFEAEKRQAIETIDSAAHIFAMRTLVREPASIKHLPADQDWVDHLQQEYLQVMTARQQIIDGGQSEYAKRVVEDNSLESPTQLNNFARDLEFRLAELGDRAATIRRETEQLEKRSQAFEAEREAVGRDMSEAIAELVTAALDLPPELNAEGLPESFQPTEKQSRQLQEVWDCLHEISPAQLPAAITSAEISQYVDQQLAGLEAYSVSTLRSGARDMFRRFESLSRYARQAIEYRNVIVGELLEQYEKGGGSV